MVVIIMAGAYIMHFAPERWTNGLKTAYGNMPLIIQALVLGAVLFLIIQTRQSDIMPFIYFQY